MIGAMPAVAVRHERRKQEKRTKKPCQLYVGGYGTKQTSPPSRGSSPTPSPLQSPPPCRLEEEREFYVFGKVSVLHIVVVSLLLGAILLIVGLVQFTPGANPKNHRYYLMGVGAFLMLVGWILAFARCFIIPRLLRRRRRQLHLLNRLRKDDSHTSDITRNNITEEDENEKDSKTSGDEDDPTDVKVEQDVVANEVASEIQSSVAASQSHDALRSVTLSPTNTDSFLKKSKSDNMKKTFSTT